MILEQLLQSWCDFKKILVKKHVAFYVHEREVWLAHIGQNIGREQNGHGEDFLRPVLVLKITSPDTFYVIPLSTKCKNKNYHILLEGVSFLRFQSYLLFDQIRVFDKKRLHRKLGKVSVSVFKKIKEKSKESL